jgi:hypothetical protein
MESKEKEDLVRVTWYEGELAVDTTGKAKGRGVYICKNPDCIAKAAKKGAFARSLRVDPGREQIERVVAQLEQLVAGPEGGHDAQ